MAISIELQRTTTPWLAASTSGTRVRFQVECAVGVSPKIFAYRLLPLQPGESSQVGFFDHVCSPSDLEDYPEDSPRDGEAPPWFRLDYVDLLVRSSAEAENLVQTIEEDVATLRLSLLRLETLGDATTITVGPACPDDEETPSDSSESSSSLSCGAVAELVADATSELSVGYGVAWIDRGLGAGTGLDDSSSSIGINRSYVSLQPGQSGQLLLLQGFDLSSLPDGAQIDGIGVEIRLRDPEGPANGDEAVVSYAGLQHQELGLSVNQAAGEAITGPDWQTTSYGGDSALWGYPEITAEQLRHGEWGLSLVVHLPFGRPATSIEIDGASLTVYYRECEYV